MSIFNVDPESLRKDHTKRIGTHNVTKLGRNKYIVENRATGTKRTTSLDNARRAVRFDDDD